MSLEKNGNITSKICLRKTFLRSNIFGREQKFWRQQFWNFLFTSEEYLTSTRLLTSSIFGRQEDMLTLKTFLTSTIFLTSILFWRQTFFLTSNKNVWRQKQILTSNNLLMSKKTFDVKKLLTCKICLTIQNGSRQKAFWRQNSFDVKQIFDVKSFLDVKQFFEDQKMFDVKKLFDVKVGLTSNRLTSNLLWRQKLFWRQIPKFDFGFWFWIFLLTPCWKFRSQVTCKVKSMLHHFWLRNPSFRAKALDLVMPPFAFILLATASMSLW